jgi:hypothetical protein
MPILASTRQAIDSLRSNSRMSHSTLPRSRQAIPRVASVATKLFSVVPRQGEISTTLHNTAGEMVGRRRGVHLEIDCVCNSCRDTISSLESGQCASLATLSLPRWRHWWRWSQSSSASASSRERLQRSRSVQPAREYNLETPGSCIDRHPST